MKLQNLIASAAFALISFGITAAEAKVFDFSFIGGGYSGSGQLVTGAAGSPYTVTGVNGTADGFSISGLSGYAGANQLLYAPPTGGFYADFSGISFVTLAGVAYNFTNYPTGNSNNLNVSTLDPGGSGGSVMPIALTITAVPEPATWAMFLLGLGAIGWTLRGTRRQQATTSVA